MVDHAEVNVHLGPDPDQTLHHGSRRTKKSKLLVTNFACSLSLFSFPPLSLPESSLSSACFPAVYFPPNCGRPAVIYSELHAGRATERRTDRERETRPWNLATDRGTPGVSCGKTLHDPDRGAILRAGVILPMEIPVPTEQKGQHTEGLFQSYSSGVRGQSLWSVYFVLFAQLGTNLLEMTLLVKG